MFGVHPFTGYFDVHQGHQGPRVLTCFDTSPNMIPEWKVRLGFWWPQIDSCLKGHEAESIDELDVNMFKMSVKPKLQLSKGSFRSSSSSRKNVAFSIFFTCFTEKHFSPPISVRLRTWDPGPMGESPPDSTAVVRREIRGITRSLWNLRETHAHTHIYICVYIYIYGRGRGFPERMSIRIIELEKKQCFTVVKWIFFMSFFSLLMSFNYGSNFFRPSKLKSIMDHHNMFFWCSYFLHWNYEVHILFYIKDHWKRV